MPQESTRNVKLFPSVIYSDDNFHQKEYARLKTLLDKGQREQVVDDLKGHYRKDKDLAYELSHRLGIDLAKELDILHYDNFKDKNASYIVVADYNAQTQEFYVSLDSEVFNQLLDTIDHYTQYQGNTADTLMSGVSGVFGGIDKGLTKAIEMIGGTKIKAAKYIFKAEGISISATYGYGSNDGDMVKTGTGLAIEMLLTSTISLILASILGLTSVPALIIIGAISALLAGILMNTQLGKTSINLATKHLIQPLINNLESKLQSFFSLFDSNPNAYELISNPNLESKDYQSLIELLLDKNSNAKDIDSLLHSFPHYLQDSKQPLESHTTDSTPTQSNTESIDSTTQSTKDSNNSTTPKNNNPNTKPNNTFPFTLQIKDYNTFTPLSNKQIQLTNIDSKQIYTQTTDSRGYVSFNIKESERGDFFCPIIIHKDYHSAQHNLSNNITQRTICPHSYANHTANVYFKQNNTQSQDNTNLVESIQFLEYIEWGIDSPQQIKIDYIGNKQDDITYPLTYPFAPGTYIELEAKLHNNIESNTPLQWGYIALHNELELQSFIESKRAYPLQYINDESQHFHTQNIYNKIGFYLPLQEYSYIVVFASTSKIDVYKDTYLIINTDFKVGEDSNNGVIESKRETQSDEQKAIYNQTSISNLKAWNALQCICNVKEAVEFLQANKTLCDSQNLSLFNYFRIYPSLAGKIAYIYYRFDMGDEGFVDEMKQTCYAIFNCKDEYVGERKEFIETITQVYTGISLCNSLIDMPKLCDIIDPNTRNYKQEFEEAFLYNKNIKKEQLIQDFINDMGKALKIKQEFMPQIQFVSFDDGNAGTYNRGTKTLSIKLLESYTQDEFIDLIDTIIHEFRHFYMYYVFENARNHRLEQSYLAQLVYGNAHMYISWEYETLFNVYDKECASFDAEVLQCEREKTYSKYDENGKQIAPYPLYYIQPSERDCRVVARAFRKKIGL